MRNFSKRRLLKLNNKNTISVPRSKVKELLQLLSDAKKILCGAQTGKEEPAKTTVEES